MEEEFEGEPILGGHDFVFVDELSPGQTCPVCLLAMRIPVQTVCGHRFCESCLLETFRGDHDPAICPEDRNPISEDGGVFRDVAWEREILSLRVNCKKSERGCDWTGQLLYYEEHFVFCKYEDVTCDDYKEEMQRSLLHKHSTSECPNRIVQCEHCKEEFVLCHTKFHEDTECKRFPLDCPQECGEEDIPREEVESHVRDDCVMTMVPCDYEEAGCTFHDKRRNLKAHLEASIEEHLSKTWSKLLKTTERLNELEELELDKEYMQRLLHRNNEEISDLRLSEKKLELENMGLRNDVAALRQQFKNYKKEMSSLKQLVQTVMESKVEANEEKHPDQPLKLKSKNYTGKKIDDSKSPAYRFFAAAVGLRTGAGKIWRKHANRKFFANFDSDDESEWSEKAEESEESSTGKCFANFDSDDESGWSEKAEESEESS